ncbi:MAG: archaeosortase A [Halobacteriaceae archaeon]
MTGPVTDALAWVTVAGFVCSALLQRRSERGARALAGATWLLFAVFWLLLVPHFAFVQKSFVEGVLTAFAVPACALVGYLTWARRPTLLVLARAVALMGLIYLPFLAVPGVAETAIEATADLSAALAGLLGYDLAVRMATTGYESQLTLVGSDGATRWVTVVLACTGIGSISVVSGLVMAVRAPLRKRVAVALGLSALIYVLNILRVTFIALAYGDQWFQFYPETVLTLFGATETRRVSYFIADRVIAQSLSLVVMVAVMVWLIGTLPGLAGVADEVGYVLTGREFELERRLTGTDSPAASAD